ncbi:MAG: NAD(P)-binding protein, partial [Deltaproteobacteria bacterium]|nr:NAD(P)-binding protein [Deltaproteobacteria bacterium]
MIGIKKVFIVGSGLMGSGIAQVCAQRGLDVVLYDIDPEALRKAL